MLLGAVGGPKWDDQPAANRPERGLLKLREGMGLYTNVRPAKMFSELSAACPLRADIAEGGIDFVVVRELIGGIYFGEHKTDDADGQPVATDIMKYSEAEIERIGRRAFELARLRRNKVSSVDKANVLETSRLWRETAQRVAREYPEVAVDYMFVDMPPGTGDVHLTVFQSLPVDGAVVVTSPQDLVSMIVAKAVKMANMMHIPVLGFVENYSYLRCPDCGKVHHIFGKSHAEEIAKKYGIGTYCQLPIDPDLATAVDAGEIEFVMEDGLDPIVEMLKQRTAEEK